MRRRIEKRGRSAHNEHWTKMVRKMMDTPAWRALSPKAQALYPWVKFEWHGPQFNNNGKIQFSCRQAAEALGIGINTAMNGFRELQAKGFLVVTRPGVLGVEGEARGPSYEITELPLPGAEKQQGRRLYLEWREGSDFPVKRHQANNPTGRNGCRSPSLQARQTCLQNSDVRRKPVSKIKTPCLKSCDVWGENHGATIINMKTSLITSPYAGREPPELKAHVSPESCGWRKLRIARV